MRNILEHLEDAGDIETINTLISNYFRLRGAVDKDSLDDKKAKQLLTDFRQIVGSDPIEQEIEKREREKARTNYTAHIEENKTEKKKLEDLNTQFISLTTVTSQIIPTKPSHIQQDNFSN